MGCAATNYLLQRKIKSGEEPPFIGLVDLKETQAQQAIARTRVFLRGDPRRIQDLFSEFSYLAAWIVASTMTRNYAEVDNKVYRHLSDALEVPLDRDAVRKALHEGFHGLCVRLGMPVDGLARMVDLYLLQAGVPQHMLDEVIDAFLRQEAQIGPPPTESTTLLNRWEDDALAYLHPTIVTPRRSILWDETAYHAGLFVRARHDGFVPRNDFEKRFESVLRSRSDAVASGRARVTDSTPRPQLRWTSDGVSLLLPRAEGRFHVSFDGGSTLRLRGGESTPLPEPWPHRIAWQVGSHDGTLTLVDGAGTCAVFNAETGQRLRELLRGEKAALDAVDVVILSREAFQVDGCPSLQQQSGVSIAYATLGRRPVCIALGGGEIRLTAEPRRRITLREGVIADGPLGALRATTAVVRLETGLRTVEERVVRVTLGGETWDRRVQTDADGIAEMVVGDLLPTTSPPDPARVTLELRPPENAGRGISTTLFLWPGFVLFDGVLLASRGAPSNFLPAQSTHAGWDGHGNICLDPAGGYAAARVAFAIDGAVVPFEVPWPEATVTRYRADGGVHFVPLGAHVSLSPQDRADTIRIRCPDADAGLTVRGRAEHGAFFASRVRNMAVRELLEPAVEHKVVLHRRDRFDLLLFEIAHALAPDAFALRPTRAGLRASFAMPVVVDAVRLELEDEDGNTASAEAALYHRPTDEAPVPWLSARIDDADVHRVSFELTDAAPGTGVRLARIFVRTPGQAAWQPLSAARGDTYAVALADMAPPAERLDRRFQRLSRWLADCYPLECWPLVETTVKRRWEALGAALFETTAGHSAMMRAATVPPPDHAAPSWVPIVHPLEIHPDLYEAEPGAFAALAASEEPGLAELSLLAELASGRLRDRDDLDPTAIIAFRNAAQAQHTGEPLIGFSVTRFLDLLVHPQIDVDPAAGWFWRGRPRLGPAHWRAAHLRFVDRLEVAGLFVPDAPLEGLNSKRRLGLQLLIQAGYEACPHKERPQVPKRDAADAEPDAIDNRAAATLCAFAFASRTRTANRYVDHLARSLGWTRHDVIVTLALLLRLGAEWFAFFMLMWQLAKERP